MPLFLVFAGISDLRADKLSFDERVEISRGLGSELATSKVLLPRSKKALLLDSDGKYDSKVWEKAETENGPAARVGDQIQITHVTIEDKKIVMEINGGLRKGKWYEHIQAGTGNRTRPITQNPSSATTGSNIALVFPDGVPPLKSAEIKQILSSVFDFEKHSATEQYVDKLPEPVKKAIQEKRSIEGMDRDQVLLAMGKPKNKMRETSSEGDEMEDWIYGEAPGKITFVTFSEGKVVKIRESYANLGGSTVETMPPH